METKDIVYVIGLVVTFVLGVVNVLYNFHINKKTTFINSVTAQRVKWIGDVRENISKFCGLTHHWSLTEINKKESNEILRELDVLRMKIKLQLNPGGEREKNVMELVDLIPDLTGSGKVNEREEVTKELISITQLLLKDEWNRVKEESQKGALKK